MLSLTLKDYKSLNIACFPYTEDKLVNFIFFNFSLDDMVLIDHSDECKLQM